MMNDENENDEPTQILNSESAEKDYFLGQSKILNEKRPYWLLGGSNP